eukprot:13927165-Alexandrium_andersonii.AAC.1
MVPNAGTARITCPFEPASPSTSLKRGLSKPTAWMFTHPRGQDPHPQEARARRPHAPRPLL